jgi:hypothetical protein
VTTFRLLYNFITSYCLSIRNNSVTWQNMESVSNGRFPGWDEILSLFFLVSWGGGWNWVHLVRRPLTGLFYQHRTIDDECGVVGGMRIGTGNWSTRRKRVPGATLSSKNPTWPAPGSNPGRRGGKPATNRLSYCAALSLSWLLHPDRLRNHPVSYHTGMKGYFLGDKAAGVCSWPLASNHSRIKISWR